MASYTFKPVVKRFQACAGVGAGRTCIWINRSIMIGKTSAPSRAVRPRPLTDTNLTLDRRYYNPQSYVNGQYSGPVDYAYPKAKLLPEKVSTTHALGEAARLQSLSRLGAGHIDLGESLPEFRKTAKMISDRLVKVADLATRVTMGDIPGVEQSLNSKLSRRQRRLMNGPRSTRLANIWLELAFGWAPLIDDVQGAIEQYHSSVKTFGDPVRSSYSITPRNEYHRPQRGLTVWSGNDLGPMALSAVSRGRVLDPGLASLNALGLVNIPLALWNSLPYSFVFDWVVPIAPILASITAGVGLSGVTTTSVTESRYERYYDNGLWSYTHQYIYRVVSPTGFLSGISLDKIRAPGLRQVADSVALLRQAI